MDSNMKVYNFAQGTPEWFEARMGLPTASRFEDVLAAVKSGEAASRRNYRAELVVQLITQKPAEPGFTTQDMRNGTEREPFARIEYEVRTGTMVQEVGFVRIDNPICGASPDGLIDHDGGIEIKCPNAASHFEYLRLPVGAAPSKYIAQIQGSMMVTNRHWWDFVSFHPDYPPATRLIVRRVMRDQTYIDRLLAELEKFNREVTEDFAFATKYQEPQC